LSPEFALELGLVALLGLIGSFGHCVGMCGPLTVAFSLAQQADAPQPWHQQFAFHLWVNLGRVVSYALVGGVLGGLGDILAVGGQLAGIDSPLRQAITVATGLLLIFLGLSLIAPGQFPHIPLVHPVLQGRLHQRLHQTMKTLAQQPRGWATVLLGMAWGLIPCGFLYAAQINAASTGSWQHGALTMLAFGLGTVPSMVTVGTVSALLSGDRRSQLYRIGGWVTLTIGVLTLLRSSDMVDYTGHASLLCLMLALIARPVSRLWSGLLHYRRALGVGACVLAIAHTLHMVDHTFEWHLDRLDFMVPQHQQALWMGFFALLGLIPAALTSVDAMVRWLGPHWRTLHLVTVPALVLAALHTGLMGSSYLGNLDVAWGNRLRTGILALLVLAVLLVRVRPVWVLLAQEKRYTPPPSLPPKASS
jgi:uncharacterized protein